MYRLCITLLFACAVVDVQAQGCESIIAMSKLQTSTVSNNQTVQEHASSFCQEYAKNKLSSGESSFGASYKFLAASYGSSNASVQAVASKYCGSGNTAMAKSDAYHEYVESIAPGAYSAYEQCLRFTKTDLKFEIDLPLLMPKELYATLAFSSSFQANRKAELRYEATVGTTCTWNGIATQEFTLATGGSASLKCVRVSSAEPSGVKVVRTDSGAQQSMSLRWIPYDSSGHPVDALVAIRKLVDALQEQLQVNSQTLARFKDAKVFSISTPKTEHKNKSLEIGKHAYCALSQAAPSHAAQPCACETSQDAATRVWTLSLRVAENVAGACACRATCIGSEP